MDKNELIQTVKTMIAAPSCCADLKAAGQKWLDAVGTADEKAAGAALLQEIKDDVCTIDDVLVFFASPAAAAHFGAEQAKAMLAQGREIKANGGKWCFCPACAAGAKILEDGSSLLA